MKQKYLGLDGMRGVAAFAVVVFHLREWLGDTPLFQGGYLAVDLFFVLSGFVIAHAYDARLAEGLGPVAFMRLRAIRLLPLLALGTGLGAMLALSTPGGPAAWRILAGFCANAVGLPSPFHGRRIFELDPPAWSLFYELLANAGFAVAFRWLGGKALGAIALISFAVLVVLGVQHGSLDGGMTLSGAPMGLARVGVSFPLGVLLHRNRALWSALVPAPPQVLLLAMTVLALALPLPASLRLAFDLGFVALLSPLLVMAGASLRTERRESRALVLLGLLSYPVYLLHAPIKRAFEHYAPAIPSSLAALLVVVLSGLAALAADRFYDVPVRRWLSGLGRRARAETEPESGPTV